MTTNKTKLGLYIHWPFCAKKCPYCDFNSHVRAAVDYTAWQTALLKELNYWAAQTARTHQLHSIFFGGGTPSTMPPSLVALLIDVAVKAWPTSNDLEITLEANPTSSEAANFVGYKAAGVNRLSLGVQSFDDEALKFLGRTHDAAEARRAIDLATQTFTRFSFDLIYARPGQTLADWQAELQQALALGTKHISLYQLTIEPNTGFAEQYKRGRLVLPPDELAHEMYMLTNNMLTAAGLPAYEVSNYAAAGQECRHNLIYWQYDDYVGIGPGAHGRVQVGGGRLATSTIKLPEAYLRAMNEAPAGAMLLAERAELMPAEAMLEAVMMGLRLSAGIDLATWQQKFGVPLEGFLRAEKINALASNGDLILTPTTLACTEQGRLRLTALLDFLLN